MKVYIMSSIIAHTALGATLGRLNRLSHISTLAIVGFCWLPDVDYVFRFLFEYDPAVRWSHSFVFILAVWLVFAGMTGVMSGWVFRVDERKHVVMFALIGGLSHLGLDWMIGSSWGDPLFWPFDNTQQTSPFGILPSSPKPSMSSVHFYRNHLIEAGILGPIFACIVLRRQLTVLKIVTALIIFIPFTWWGISLPR